jgi:transposase
VEAEKQVRAKWRLLQATMNERARRLWAGAEAEAMGWGGVAAVARATGLAISTVRKGRDEVRRGACAEEVVHARRPGGGRPRHEVAHPTLWPALETLVDPVRRGDPESPLRWTCKSTHQLAAEMFTQYGIRVSDKTVARLLRENGYSLQAPNKSVEGAQHPDRNEQFEHINAQAQDCIERGVPFISVDTKKKELVGNFKNAGQEWHPKGEPELVDVHDFPDQAVGKAIPYGVYDIAANDGFVNVGTDHDTPVFAATSIESSSSATGRGQPPRGLACCRLRITTYPSEASFATSPPASHGPMRPPASQEPPCAPGSSWLTSVNTLNEAVHSMIK